MLTSLHSKHKRISLSFLSSLFSLLLSLFSFLSSSDLFPSPRSESILPLPPDSPVQKKRMFPQKNCSLTAPLSLSSRTAVFPALEPQVQEPKPNPKEGPKGPKPK